MDEPRVKKQNYVTIWTIIGTRLLAFYWPAFRELMVTYPEVVYAVDGAVLAVLRYFSTRGLKWVS